ncbi:MAG: histidine kinase dimerization/phospho-acceptor domain-containing protein, partial [Reichenbachiella sp.]
KIKEQLNTMEKYVNMNSHQLRVPLSNILGLVNLLKEKKRADTELSSLVENLDGEAQALDGIIKEMNTLLENEMKFHSNGDEIEASH